MRREDTYALPDLQPSGGGELAARLLASTARGSVLGLPGNTGSRSITEVKQAGLSEISSIIEVEGGGVGFLKILQLIFFSCIY